MSKESTKTETPKCFVIMPIADPEGYDKGHFKKVYEDILKVSCEKSGFQAIRADEVQQTNLIHLDILQKLISAPMAICDLSNRNPNVLFELGLRQAFDKPTVLIQEVGTPKIFDIAPLRYTEYRRELKYRDVLEDQDSIAEAIKATKIATDKGDGINSIISLLSLSSPASLREVTDNDSTRMLQIVMSEMNELRIDFRKTLKRLDGKEYNIINNSDSNIALNSDLEYKKIRNTLSKMENLVSQGAPVEEVQYIYDNLQFNIITLLNQPLSPFKLERFRSLLNDANILMASYGKEGKVYKTF